MKWGRINDVPASQRLLYWVLMFLVSPYFEDPIDHWMKDVLIEGGGIGGDPGWEIEHVQQNDGIWIFRVWADSEMSGIEPDEAIYSLETMRCALRESLLSLGEAYPERSDEAREIIRRYGL